MANESSRRTVFFSWQDDTPAKEGRHTVERALERAIASVAKDLTVEEAVRDGLEMDKDTQGVAGSPPIFQTILDKIDVALAFVADLTFCSVRPDGRRSPNPNVLIEYGWALKSIGHLQMVGVMNSAYGEPSRSSLPFDLAHLRFPITYNLPEGADETTRKLEREKLSKVLESAPKDILQDKGIQKKFSQSERPPEFSEKKPLSGESRFRDPTAPIGIVEPPLPPWAKEMGPNYVTLTSGPTVWLRMMPSISLGQKLLIKRIKEQAIRIAILPLVNYSGGDIFGVRGDDGYGYFQADAAGKMFTLAYMFDTGEVWLTNVAAARSSQLIELDEETLVETFTDITLFFRDLGFAEPYKWLIGMEGIKGRLLSIPGRLNNPGPFVTGLIQDSGTYKASDKAADLLRPFFERVFDQCGSERITA